MDIDELNKRINELIEKLEGIKPEEPAYKTIAEELSTLYKIADQYEQRDMNRINNNMQNDINQMRVEVEMEKVKVDRTGKLLTTAEKVLATVGALGVAWLSFERDKEFKIPIRGVAEWVKVILPKR